MKKLLSTCILLNFILPTVANAASDWTAVVKPIVSGCYDEFQLENLSKEQKASIVSKKIKKLSDETQTTYILKNATAYGYPITKIRIERTYDPSQTLYFANEKFMALEKLNSKVDASATLKFNKKEKSISCSWSDGS